MRILIATDLSSGADAAMREGAITASPSDALGVVHVLPAIPDSGLREKALTKIRAQAANITNRAVEVFVDGGVDYAEIVKRAEAWRADLIVVGSYGQSGLKRAVGRVAERVVRHAHGDVLLARTTPTTGGGVLAATDLSEPSFPAIVAGADQARRRKTHLEVVQAVGFLNAEADYIFELATPGLTPSGQDVDEQSLLLSNTIKRLATEATGKILELPAAPAIVGEAESIGAHLVVVGTRGRTGLARVMLGSTAEKVMHAAHCSVLLVRLREPK